MAKHVIAAIWSSNKDRQQSDALRLEYHNVQLVIGNDNKEMLTYWQTLSSPSEQLDVPLASLSRAREPGAGPSEAPKYTIEDFDLSEKPLKILDEEEQLSLECRDV